MGRRAASGEPARRRVIAVRRKPGGFMSQHAQGTEGAHRLVSSPAGRIHLVEQGTGPLVLLRARLPRVLVLLAPPAPGARRGRLPGGRHRRPRLRPLLQARATWRRTGCSTWSRTTSPWCTPSASETAVIVGPRLGLDHRRQLRPAQAGRLPRRRPAERAVRAARRAPAQRGLRADGRRRGVLRLLLPGARPGRGGDRTRRPRLARRLLRRPVRRHHARPRRARTRTSSAGAGRCATASPPAGCPPGSARTTSTSTPGSSSAPA